MVHGIFYRKTCGRSKADRSPVRVFRYFDSGEADEHRSYQACATINGAVRSITANSVALIESGLARAVKHNTDEEHRHVVGMARTGQQYYIYSSIFDPRKCEGEPPRIRSQHGCINLINLLDTIRTPTTVTVPAVKNTQGKAVKGCGKTISNVWMTGSASSDLNALTGAASFIHHVASGQAGVSPVQPQSTNTAGYQWVRLAW